MCIYTGEHVLPLCPFFEEVPDHALECVDELQHRVGALDACT